MKKTSSFIHGLAACAVVFALVSPLAAQDIQGKAKVIRISGHARYMTAGGAFKPLKVGDVLGAGTVIQTEKEQDAFVDLVLGDGNAPLPTSFGMVSSSIATPVSNFQPKAEQNVVRVYANSALGIDKLTSVQTGADTVTDTQLDLKAGHIFGTVKKMSAASKYDVKLPNGVAGIRGTTYDITADGVVKVSKGSVVLAYVGSDGSVTTKVIVGGQMFDARTGQLSPISDSELKFLNALANSIVVANGTPVTSVVDKTIHHVSNSHGHHGHGHGHGDDGGDDGPP